MSGNRDDAPEIDPAHYSREYFLTGCDGFEQFEASQGRELPPRLKALWGFLDAQPGMRLLDIGCGRGEIVWQCRRNQVQGIGLDYSPQALSLARESGRRLEQAQDGLQPPSDLVLADCRRLPFHAERFNRVLMSDVVEHLTPSELGQGLREVCRVLAPGGKLVIHTMPNLWYYRYGYPLFRLARRLSGEKLPPDPRQRHLCPHVHINEQTPPALRRALQPIGFRRTKIWLYDYHDYPGYPRRMQWLMKSATTFPLIKKIFNNDIFAIAEK